MQDTDKKVQGGIFMELACTFIRESQEATEEKGKEEEFTLHSGLIQWEGGRKVFIPKPGG